MKGDISVERKEKVVHLWVDTDLPHENGGTTLLGFKHESTSLVGAELLRRYIRDLILGHDTKIRKEYYDLGWKDAKAKKHGKLF